jgi:hypothetical protein
MHQAFAGVNAVSDADASIVEPLAGIRFMAISC